MHKENILMTVELRELWSPSRTALMALKCSSGKRLKSGGLGNQGWAPWNRHSRGPTTFTVESRCMRCAGGKETQMALLKNSLGRGLNLNRDIAAEITISKTWLLVLLVGFWQRRRMWQEWGPHCDCGQKCLRTLQVFSALLSFCVM